MNCHILDIVLILLLVRLLRYNSIANRPGRRQNQRSYIIHIHTGRIARNYTRNYLQQLSVCLSVVCVRTVPTVHPAGPADEEIFSHESMAARKRQH